MYRWLALLLTAVLLLPTPALADPAVDPVRDVIQRYIDSSAHSETEALTKAFHPDATLYLTSATGFARYSREQYAAFFADREVGKFNGRVGKILSIEIVNDIAMAKASIDIPARNRRYIDLFLLKKTGDQWQIISKTATQL